MDIISAEGARLLTREARETFVKFGMNEHIRFTNRKITVYIYFKLV